jgi:hypothetical protein
MFLRVFVDAELAKLARWVTALKGKDWQRIVHMLPGPEAARLLADDASSRMVSARFAGPLPNCSHPRDTNEQR